MANVIEIWSPKWSSSEVYIAHYKVRDGRNIIHFTEAKIPDLEMDGAAIRAYPMTTNGKIPVYKVPIAHFTRVDNGQLELLKEVN